MTLAEDAAYTQKEQDAEVCASTVRMCVCVQVQYARVFVYKYSTRVCLYTSTVRTCVCIQVLYLYTNTHAHIRMYSIPTHDCMCFMCSLV